MYLIGEVVALVSQVPHDRVLDVGPGFGKYAVLLRELLNEPPAVIDCVEAWPPYVIEHGLDCLYRRVLVGDVCAVPEGELDPYDVVLMVDVIEHIDKREALALLQRIRGRVAICTPVDWFDNDPASTLPPTEAHVSHWSQADWDTIAQWRPVEVCYESLGGWLVRLGPMG